jgi:cellulose synthase operon protein B
MKTYLRIWLFVLMMIELFGSHTNVAPVRAAPLVNQAIFTLADVTNSEILLHGPYDSRQIRFNLAPTWLLQGGTELRLVISTYSSVEDVSSNEETNNINGALLNVSFNGELQQSLPLVNGKDILYSIPIRPSSLTSPRKDGSLEISFFLDASYDCDVDFQHTTVVISASSQIMVEYTDAAVKMDLSRLPWPIYQPAAIVNQAMDEELEQPSALVVVSDNASIGELHAALVVMGAFGRMTNQKLPMLLVTSSELTGAMRENNDLIFVGRPDSLSLLKQLLLPLPIEDSHFASSGMQGDDGVLQMTASPWATTKTLLVVGGNTDAGVIKAAQALSSGNVLQTGSTSTYSVVAQVNPISISSALTTDATPLSSPDFTLADLGYQSYTTNQIGVNWISYEYIIPPGQIPTEKPYLDLNFSNSALVDVDRSGLVVYLNGTLVGSSRFSEETSDITVERVNLPASSLLPGRNKIDLAVNLLPQNVCDSFSSFQNLWFTVYPESILHLPLIGATGDSNNLQDLHSYPFPFLNDPSLSTTTFVLPRQDASAWSVAGDVAYNLGGLATGGVVSFDAVFDGDLSDEARVVRDLIVIGLPKELSILADASQAMPAHFESNSNIAILENQLVIYRIDSQKDLGYLEFFVSPWNPSLSVLAILGTTPQGVKIAGEALLSSQTRNQLRGNFATVDGEQVLAVDTRTGLGTGRLPSFLGSDVVVEQASVPNQSQEPSTLPSNNKTTILYALAGIVFLIVVVIAGALITRKSRNKNNRSETGG